MFSKKVLLIVLTSVLLTILMISAFCYFLLKPKITYNKNINGITIESLKPQYIDALKYTYKRQTNMPFRCNENLPIIKELDKQFTGSRLLFFGNLLNLNQEIKYATDEPYFSFPVDDAYQIEFKTQFNNIEDVNAKINIVLSNLVKNGFEIDTINGPRFAIKKASERYILKPSLSSIDISCTGNSIKNNISRDVLLEVNAVAKYTPDTIVEIWDANDNGLRLNIGSINTMGGHGDYWFKINGNWKKVYTGQSMPRCEEIGKYHAGKGLPCGCSQNSPPTCNGIINY